jgi:hypothetical protein
VRSNGKVSYCSLYIKRQVLRGRGMRPYLDFARSYTGSRHLHIIIETYSLLSGSVGFCKGKRD